MMFLILIGGCSDNLEHIEYLRLTCWIFEVRVRFNLLILILWLKVDCTGKLEHLEYLNIALLICVISFVRNLTPTVMKFIPCINNKTLYLCLHIRLILLCYHCETDAWEELKILQLFTLTTLTLFFHSFEMGCSIWGCYWCK